MPDREQFRNTTTTRSQSHTHTNIVACDQCQRVGQRVRAVTDCDSMQPISLGAHTHRHKHICDRECTLAAPGILDDNDKCPRPDNNLYSTLCRGHIVTLEIMFSDMRFACVRRNLGHPLRIDGVRRNCGMVSVTVFFSLALTENHRPLLCCVVLGLINVTCVTSSSRLLCVCVFVWSLRRRSSRARHTCVCVVLGWRRRRKQGNSIKSTIRSRVPVHPSITHTRTN